MVVTTSMVQQKALTSQGAATTVEVAAADQLFLLTTLQLEYKKESSSLEAMQL